MFEDKICQSCAMPMKKDSDFGKNADGTINEDYCIHCFSNGNFIQDISLQDQINKLVKIGVQQLGMTKKQAKEMAETKLPSLKRWIT